MRVLLTLLLVLVTLPTSVRAPGSPGRIVSWLVAPPTEMPTSLVLTSLAKR